MHQCPGPALIPPWQRNDPTYEPEDESLCGVVQHNRPPVANTPEAQGHDDRQLEFKHVSSCNTLARDVEEICKVGPAFIRMARGLVAKRAVEKYLRRRAKAALKATCVNFERLPCCVENAELQTSIQQAEQQIGRQSLELKNVTRARNEEVAQLSAEVSHLQEQLQLQEDLLEEGGHDCTQELKMQLDRATARSRVEAEDLRQQLKLERSDSELVRQQTLHAQREASDYRAKITMYRKTHEEEMAQMHLRLKSAVPQGAKSEADLESSRRKIADLETSLKPAIQTRDEAQKVLDTERKLQQQEIDLLSEELKSIRAETKGAQQLQQGQEMGTPQQREIGSHEDVLRDASQKLQADKTLHDLEESDRKLLKECLQLYGPASTFLSMFGQPVLPGCGAAEDPVEHIEWLQSLSVNLADLYEQLRSRMQDGQI